MKNNFLKISVLLCLLFIEILSLFLSYKSFSNKALIKENVKTNEIDKKQFSMYIENEEGNYEEYIESNKFPEGYQINIEKSKCVDTKGNVINGILTGSGTNITITSNKTSYCYLYFDIKELTASEYLIENVSSDMLWDSTLEEDGYRYVGTNPDNYICFGTIDKDECRTDTDKYMYRIIGIFEDEEGQQHLKLIKKEALNTAYRWNADFSNDVNWENSDLYKGLNGSYFLNNNSYSYMQNEVWKSKIVDWNYTATNTKTYESSGPYYYYMTVKSVYMHEMNRQSKTNEICKTYYYDYDLEIEEIINSSCIHGSWKSIDTKIGLIYLSDYLLSLGLMSLNYTSSSNASMLKAGWMHLSNNDSAILSTTLNNPPSSNEFVMTRMGEICGDECITSAWVVYINGSVDAGSRSDDILSVRPVFYLTSDATISGEGTTTNPYIITN